VSESVQCASPIPIAGGEIRLGSQAKNSTMTASRTVTLRELRTLIAAMGYAGGLALVTGAHASSLVAAAQSEQHRATSPLQYWGGHGA
jgi:hypothetical protein